MIKFYLLLAIVFCSLPASAQKAAVPDYSLPIPDVPNLLFYIQRDPDVNTVVYTLNTDNSGQIDQKDPIKIFLIKYTEGGAHKPLNLLQKAVAYPKMEMQLLKGQDNKYHIRLALDNRKCVLKRIFIRITGGSHLHPDVAYLEFHGIELGTGKAVSQRVFPD